MLKQLLGSSAARNARPNARREATKRSSKFIVFNSTTQKLPYPSDSWPCLYSPAQTALLQQSTLASSWQLAGASARRLNLHPPLVFSFSGLSEGVPYEPTHTTPANSRIFRMLNFINKATYWSVHGAPARCATTRISPRFRQGGRESAGGDSRKSAIFFRASVCVCEVEFTHQTVVLTYLEHSM